MRFVSVRGYRNSHGNITFQARRGIPRTGMSLPLRSSTVSLNRLAVDCSKTSIRLSDKSRVSSLFRWPIPSGHWSRPALLRRRCFILRRFDTSIAHSLIGLLDTLRGQKGGRRRREGAGRRVAWCALQTFYENMTWEKIPHTYYWAECKGSRRKAHPALTNVSNINTKRRKIHKPQYFSGITLPRFPPSLYDQPRRTPPSSTKVHLFHPNLRHHSFSGCPSNMVTANSEARGVKGSRLFTKSRRNMFTQYHRLFRGDQEHAVEKMNTCRTHFRSVSVLKVSTADGPSVRRFPSNRNFSRDARRGPFSFLPTGRMECTFSLLSERLRWVNSEREFIVSGRLLKLLPLRSRLVKAVLSPTTLGT